MKRLPGLAIAAGVALAFSLNVQAQDCTIGNWGDSENADALDVGTRANGFSRYAGPCSLRVSLSSDAAYVVTPAVDGGSSYNARFYMNRADAGSSDIMIFAAQDGSAENLVQIHYNDPSAGDFSLHAFNGSTETVTILGSDIPTSEWVSVEFSWTASDSGNNLIFNVSGVENTGTLDTSGQLIVAGLLGNVTGSGSTGVVYFDDFDSRRETRPGRLCRGLTDTSRAPASDGWQRVTNADRDAIFTEIATRGFEPADGQPDFNEDGAVNNSDRDAIFQAIAFRENSCEILTQANVD